MGTTTVGKDRQPRITFRQLIRELLSRESVRALDAVIPPTSTSKQLKGKKYCNPIDQYLPFLFRCAWSQVLRTGGHRTDTGVVCWLCSVFGRHTDRRGGRVHIDLYFAEPTSNGK